MKLLDGRPLARSILKRVKKEIAKMPLKPGLAVLLVGSDPASKLYVSIKEEVAKELGLNFRKIVLPESVPEKELAEVIETLNKDRHIHGILLQLPLPSHLNVREIITHIDQRKDVDGFLEESGIASPTIQAIKALLKKTNEILSGKKAALLVKSEAFYRGIEKALSENDIIATRDLSDADIVISAKGKPRSLAGKQIKKGAIVIDVGIGFTNGKTVGDSASDVSKKAGFLSPVPGGVGPLTVAYLFQNLIELTKRHLGNYYIGTMPKTGGEDK